MTGRKLRMVLALIFAAILALSCSGGSPVSPDERETANGPREVLNTFADACVSKDVNAACSCLLNPARWRHTLELGREALPLLGNSVRGAREEFRERDRVRFGFDISNPSDPHRRILRSNVFVVRSRGNDGNAGVWRIDFVRPEVNPDRLDRPASGQFHSANDRQAQWGTLYAHASILSRAILAYYFTMYPEDLEFSGPYGFLNPHNFKYPMLAAHPGPVETILSIDYDIYDSIPPEAVTIYNVASALVQAGSADEDVFVGELNEDGSVNFTRDIVLKIAGHASFETLGDFGDDDDTLLKGFAHFLTPATQNIWETEFAPFDDAGILGGTGGASVSALNWALGEGTLGPYDVLGILEMRASRNRKTFQQAVDLLSQARVAPNGLVGAELSANSFYTLGYSLHLLEDQSCPAHCRNDMHGVPIISSIPGLGGLQPDPAEDWGETLNSSFVIKTISLYKQLLAEDNPIVRDISGFPNDPVLQNLYLTASHADYPGVEALFEYTSLISNRMCFSEDTIYTSTNYDAANTDYYPDLTYLNLDFFGRTVLHGTPGDPISSDSYLVAVGNGLFDWWRSWFWSTNWFSDPELEDVEDALRNGWDILTVEDDADEDYFANGTIGVREQQWSILFPHIVRTGAAYLHEFYINSK